MKEEEDAIARDQAKKQKANDFFNKIKENSNKILLQQKKDKAQKAEEKVVYFQKCKES